MEFGKRYAVYSVKKGDRNGAVIWVRAGYAWANRDGSANVWLDVLPLDGKLHIRDAAERREYAGSTTTVQQPQPKQQTEAQPVQMVDMQSMGGH